MSLTDNRTALILSGGGARAAYQVGVLLALKEILFSANDKPDQATPKNPFPIIVGTSAGAINGVSLAANSHNFQQAVDLLVELWADLDIEHVFRTDWKSLLGAVMRIGRSFFHQGVDYHRPLSLLDNSPLNGFLKQHIKFSHIQDNIDQGILAAISVTALGYTSTNSVSFFQGEKGLEEWARYRRIGRRAVIGMEHLLASSAISCVFPTVRIGNEYFGDGAMRQLAPISPALHLGADRVFIVGVSSNRAGTVVKRERRRLVRHPPSVAQLAGQMLNSALIDSLEADIEHIERVNDLLHCIPQSVLEEQGIALRPVKTLVISPSKQLDKIAGRHVRYLPKALRYVLRSSGATARRGGSAISSYLLFTASFTQELIDLGYQDAMWDRDKIKAFFDED